MASRHPSSPVLDGALAAPASPPLGKSAPTGTPAPAARSGLGERLWRATGGRLLGWLWGLVKALVRRFLARFKWEVIMGSALGSFAAVLLIYYFKDLLTSTLYIAGIALCAVVAVYLLFQVREYRRRPPKIRS